jgi:antitoxin CptB
MGETCEVPANATRRKRLAFRAWHRGTREADLLIGNFANRVLPDLDNAGLDQFEALLECSDADVYEWMTGRATPHAPHDHELMRQLKEFRLGHSER